MSGSRAELYIYYFKEKRRTKQATRQRAGHLQRHCGTINLTEGIKGLKVALLFTTIIYHLYLFCPRELDIGIIIIIIIKLKRQQQAMEATTKDSHQEEQGGGGHYNRLGLSHHPRNDGDLPDLNRGLQSSSSGSIFIESLIFFALMMAFSVLVWVFCRYRYV